MLGLIQVLLNPVSLEAIKMLIRKSKFIPGIVLKIFMENTNWASIGIHPIRRKKTGKQNTDYTIREKGSSQEINNGKKYKGIHILTEELIRDILYEGESNSINEVGDMRDVETHARTLTRLEKEKS